MKSSKYQFVKRVWKKTLINYFRTPYGTMNWKALVQRCAFQYQSDLSPQVFSTPNSFEKIRTKIHILYFLLFHDHGRAKVVEILSRGWQAFVYVTRSKPLLADDLGPIPETIRSLWKSDRITNFSSAHDFSIRSDSTNDPASIGSWSWRSCSLLGSVLDQKFHHNNWSFYQ